MAPRLLILSSTYPRWRDDPEPGFVHELARRLAGEFEVAVLAPHAPGASTDEILDGVRVRRWRYAPALLETLVNDGGIVANLRRAPWKWLLVPGFLLGLAWSCWRLMRELRPRVVHAHWLLPQGLVAALLDGEARLLVTSHGADLYALRAAPLQALKRRVARAAHAVTVVSAPMREELARLGVDAAKVRVAPMGVDLGRAFTPAAGPRAGAEILFVGRLVEKKGLRHLLDALPAVRRAHPAATLSIVGFGPEEPALRAQAAGLGLGDAVRFLGPLAQSALPALYRRAAVFVAPFVPAASGDQEGLGLVVVEALGCGCPVVASDLPPVRDIFGAAAPRGLVAPGSAPALGEAIGRVLSDPAGAAAEAAALREAARARFDWEVVARGYAAILRDLAA
jgi:glycosyltransferase involved in cell wall biosynthesis